MSKREEELRTAHSRYYREHYFDEQRSQSDMILEYLKRFESITPMEALTACGCFRLSARIADLKALGYDIRTHIHDGKKKYAIYTLVEE